MLTGPDPAGPDPAGPEPAGPEPAGPDPAGPDPAGPDPAGERCLLAGLWREARLLGAVAHGALTPLGRALLDDPATLPASLSAAAEERPTIPRW